MKKGRRSKEPAFAKITQKQSNKIIFIFSFQALKLK
jgi:hypothetical protein